MATLISETDFIGFINIDFSSIADDFTSYAEQLEQKILTELFGVDMYNDYISNPSDPIYTSLIEDYNLVLMLDYFFFYYYLRDRQSYSSTLGEFASDAENSLRLTQPLTQKIVRTYNSGVSLYDNAADYLKANTITYTDYTDSEYIEKLNMFGI